MERVHAALPRPAREREHIRVREVVPDVQLERDDERLRGAVHRAAAAAPVRVGGGGRVEGRGGVVGDGEAGRELPYVRRGEVEDLMVALDLGRSTGSVNKSPRERGGRGAGTDLAHGAQEGFHAPAGEAARGRGLEEDGAELDGGAVGELERHYRLGPGQDEVERAVIPSAGYMSILGSG